MADSETGLPILYSFRRCPYAIRARMALLISGTRVELREVALAEKPAEMVAASPKATVPVLIDVDGSVIDESLGIMRWALEQHDPAGWLDGEDATLIRRFDGDFKHHLDRYKYPDRHGEDRVAHRDAALALLHPLDAWLCAQQNLTRHACSITDIAIMPFIRQFAAVDQGWFYRQPVPHLQSWLARHTGSALFEAAMLRVKPWAAGDAPVLLNPGSAPPLPPP